MRVIKTYFEIENQHHNIITGDIYFPDNANSKFPLIIISHGFTGFKDWGFFPYVSSTFAELGFIVICYNFSMNGNPDNDLIITDPDSFAENTVTLEIEDLQYFIDSIAGSSLNEFEIFKTIWDGSIYLMGYSLGGGISLIAGYNNPIVSKIALWASISKFDRYTERQKMDWKEKGFLEFTDHRTNQLLRMNAGYLEDIEKHQQKYDLPAVISLLQKPVLLIHGKQDITVTVKEAQMLIDADKNNIITCKIIERSGHTFGIEHPFTKTTPALEEAIKSTIDFFRL